MMSAQLAVEIYMVRGFIAVAGQNNCHNNNIGVVVVLNAPHLTGVFLYCRAKAEEEHAARRYRSQVLIFQLYLPDYDRKFFREKARRAEADLR